MIKFITGESSDIPPTFGDVQEDQFFVSQDGDLCQKRTPSIYHIIARKSGVPFSGTVERVAKGAEIERTLPTITKIESMWARLKLTKAIGERHIREHLLRRNTRHKLCFTVTLPHRNLGSGLRHWHLFRCELQHLHLLGGLNLRLLGRLGSGLCLSRGDLFGLHHGRSVVAHRLGGLTHGPC